MYLCPGSKQGLEGNQSGEGLDPVDKQSPSYQRKAGPFWVTNRIALAETGILVHQIRQRTLYRLAQADKSDTLVTTEELVIHLAADREGHVAAPNYSVEGRTFGLAFPDARIGITVNSSIFERGGRARLHRQNAALRKAGWTHIRLPQYQVLETMTHDLERLRSRLNRAAMMSTAPLPRPLDWRVAVTVLALCGLVLVVFGRPLPG